jgi:carotenoid cleavage dioxygenase-like enzyme
MVHDCAITKNYVLLLDLPVVLDPNALESGTLPYAWRPSTVRGSASCRATEAPPT